jgi:hypothetical protein
VQNFGHSEVLIRMTDETPLLLDLKEKFVTLNIYSIGETLSISLQERVILRNVLIWLHRMDSFSLLMDLFVGAELAAGVMSGNHMP